MDTTNVDIRWSQAAPPSHVVDNWLEGIGTGADDGVFT